MESFRSDLLQQVGSYLGARIALEERAVRAFEVHRRIERPGAPLAPHLWVSLERELPLISELYERLGVVVDTSTSPFPKLERRRMTSGKYDPAVFEWRQSLQAVFGAPHDLTETAHAVRRTGLLRAADLVLSLLEPKKRRLGADDRWVATHNYVLRAFAQHASRSQDDLDSLAIAGARAREAWLALCHFDVSLGDQQLVVWNDGQRYRVAPFGVFGGFVLQDQRLRDGSVWIARGNVIQPAEPALEPPLREFEELLNSDPEERTLQRFFERYPEFLTALGPYAAIHPQLILHHGEGRLIPDFFLERSDSDFSDICDLKRPTADLVRHQRNRARFKDAVMEGIAQLDVYRNWFEDPANREAFRSRYGLSVYRPEIVLIIGRRRSYYDDVQRLQLETNLPRWVRLTTYDDVLERTRLWLRRIKAAWWPVEGAARGQMVG